MKSVNSYEELNFGLSPNRESLNKQKDLKDMGIFLTGAIILIGIFFISKNLGILHNSLKDIKDRELD
jgi:hypothetical protein